MIELQEQFGNDEEAILLRVRDELKYSLRLYYLITGSETS